MTEHSPENAEKQHNDEVAEQIAHVRMSEDGVGDYLRTIGKAPLLTAEQEIEVSKRIEAGLFAEYIVKSDIQRNDIEMEELEWLIQDGRTAKDTMIISNLRLVVSIAKKHLGRGLSFQDLIQEGNGGLMRAVEKFDYTKGFKFSTYGTWWIRQAISRGIGNDSRTIRLPVHVVEKLARITSTRRQMRVDLGIEPTSEEVAMELDMKVEDVINIEKSAWKLASLDRAIGDENDTQFSDMLVDESAIMPDEAAEYVVMKELVQACIAALPSRDADIIKRRFGFYNGRPQTLDEIGKVHDLTRERIRQIEVKAKKELALIAIQAGLRDLPD